MAGIRRDVRSQSAADCGTFPATRRQARCTPRPRLRHRGTMPGRFGICFADEHLVFFRVSFYTALRSGRPFPPSRTSFANPSPPGIPFSRRDWCRDTAKFDIPEAGMTMACSGVAGKSCSGTANIRKIRRTSFLRINGMTFFRMMPQTEYGLQTLGGCSGPARTAGDDAPSEGRARERTRRRRCGLGLPRDSGSIRPVAGYFAGVLRGPEHSSHRWTPARFSIVSGDGPCAFDAPAGRRKPKKQTFGTILRQPVVLLLGEKSYLCTDLFLR